MPRVLAYHRPATLDDALALLAEDGRVALAGGTVVNAGLVSDTVGEVVDLQALGLAGVVADGARCRLGATTTLDVVAGPGSGADLVPALVRTCARAEQPSTLRTLATVGGTVATRDPDSVLLAALLVHDAEVELARAGVVPLPDLLATGVPAGDLILAVTIATDGVAASSSTGRTPADVPIVAAVARRRPDGTVAVALTGVAATPVLADPDDPVADLAPPSDFRGSSEYRRHLAERHTARVLADVQEGLR